MCVCLVVMHAQERAVSQGHTLMVIKAEGGAVHCSTAGSRQDKAVRL